MTDELIGIPVSGGSGTVDRDADLRRRHPLATKSGIETVVGLLFFMGAMCPKCGYGTRVTSKKWSKCKRCGERVERRELPEIAPESSTPQPSETPATENPEP